MNRLTSFLLGIVVGAVGLYLSMNYYIVRASDGLHFVPKLAAKIEFPYFDIREYTLTDWQTHQVLAASIIRSNKTNLLEGSAFESLRRSTNQMLEQFTGAQPDP
jgi:hypothetical protein